MIAVRAPVDEAPTTEQAAVAVAGRRAAFRGAELLPADSGVGAPSDREADATRDRAAAAVGVEIGTVASDRLGQGFIREMP